MTNDVADVLRLRRIRRRYYLHLPSRCICAVLLVYYLQPPITNLRYMLTII